MTARCPNFLNDISQLKAINNSLTVDSWEEAGAQVVVEALVLAHFIHTLPLRFCHLFLDGLWCDLFISLNTCLTILKNESLDCIP